MLGVAPEQEALLVVAQWWQRYHWSQALVGIVVGVHLLGAFTLTFAPDAQLFTQDTRPVFALAPPPVWAAAFLAGGAAAAVLLHRVTLLRWLTTWLIVLPTQTIWLGASVIAIAQGGGSAMFVVFQVAVLAFTTVTAVAAARDHTTGKR